MSARFLRFGPQRIRRLIAGGAIAGGLLWLSCAREATPAQEPGAVDPPAERKSTTATEAAADTGPALEPTAQDAATDSVLERKGCPANATVTQVFEGFATYYSDRLAGHRTASGDTYQPGALTAAHRTLPFGTLVRVLRSDTNPPRWVCVRINDRGPFAGKKRIIDISKQAARELEMVHVGVVPVRVEVLKTEH